MLNIQFFPPPKIEDFGIYNDEISKIETFVIIPKKKGNREDVLFFYSIIIYYRDVLKIN